MKTPLEQREYVIKNYEEGHNYGLYILQLYANIYHYFGINKRIPCSELHNVIRGRRLGPSDMPYRKFDYIDDLVKMKVLVIQDDYYLLTDLFLKYIEGNENLSIKEENDTYIVHVSFSDSMKKGIQYSSKKKHSVGDIVYVTGKYEGRPGKVVSIEMNVNPRFHLESVID